LNNKLYVVNKGKVGERTISVIDTETDKVQGAPIMIEGYPHDILAVGNKIYVATSDNISVIDPATEQVQAIINLKRAEKLELMSDRKFSTRDEARSSIFEYVEVFYNRKRRHSTLGYLPPEVFEAEFHAGRFTVN
jgi:YVTN family beta-propeller protein